MPTTHPALEDRDRKGEEEPEGGGEGGGGGGGPRWVVVVPSNRTRAAEDIPPGTDVTGPWGGTRAAVELTESATLTSSGAFGIGVRATNTVFSITRCWNMGLDTTSEPSVAPCTADTVRKHIEQKGATCV